MIRPLNVLIIGKDPTLFEHKETVIGDTRKRHITYSDILQSKFPGSQIRIITYTRKQSVLKTEKVSEYLFLYGTGSLHRASYVFGVIGLLPKVLSHGWRPDIVTVQTPWEEGVIGYFVSRLCNAKFILQLHFDLFSQYWKSENRLNLWRSIIARALIRKADAIRVVSEFQKCALVDRLGISADKIQVIPVGVNFQPLYGEKSNFKKMLSTSLERKKVVLFVGKFYAPKNLHLWVNVAQLISRRLTDVKFVMAGSGPMFEEIKADVDRRKLSELFIFPGYVRHEDLPEIYAAADVFLLSSFYEGFGRVVLEACLAGIPVVSTTCAGTLDLIDHGATGILCPVDDADSLATAVIDLLKNDELRSLYGEKGREKVEAEYNFSKLANDLVDFWGEACNERP